MKHSMGLITFALISWATAASAELIGPEEAERARLRRHFAVVQTEMSARTPAGLSEAAMQNRRAIIAELGRYAERGVFPRNTRHPNRRQPYFIDDEERACAVGHLMIQSGYESLAQDIATHQNNAYVHDIRHAELGPWLETHGITADEAALIQPGYCDCPQEENAVCGSDGNSYFNHCHAQLCAGVDVARCGVCNLGDDYTTVGPSNSQQTLDEYCAANDCSCFGSDDDDGSGCTVSHAPSRRDGDPLALLLGLAMATMVWRKRPR